jgi:hypothetical protein
MRHDIVAQLLFLRLSHVKINVINVGPEFSDLFLGDAETDFSLGLGQRDPEATPGLEFVLR